MGWLMATCIDCPLRIYAMKCTLSRMADYDQDCDQVESQFSNISIGIRTAVYSATLVSKVWQINVLLKRVSLYLILVIAICVPNRITNARMRIYISTSLLISLRFIPAASAQPRFFLLCLLLIPLPFEQHRKEVQEVEFRPQDI